MKLVTCPPVDRAPAGAHSRTARLTLLAAALGVLASCVTVNVYFPAAAAQKAADKIINAVTSGSTNGTGSSSSPHNASSSSQPPTSRNTPPTHSASLLASLAGGLVNALVPVAHAAGQPNLDISTPQIRAIIADMRQRFAQLKPYFNAGVIGMTAQGVIAVRDQNAVPLMKRARLTQLVAHQNSDLSQLYTQIADANGHPEWAANIRKTFAGRWIANAKRNGWYYRNAGGTWVKG